MKRISILIAVLCFLGITSAQIQAQNTFNKSNLVFDANIGIGSYSGFKIGLPPVAISGEYGIVDNLFDDKSSIGVGAYIGFASYKDVYDTYWYERTNKLTRMCFGARGLFHYQLVDNLDTYGGIMLGIYTYSYKYTYKDYYDYHGDYEKVKSNHVGFAASVFVGARYYFGEHFAVMSELGYGFTYFSLGVSYKL